MKLAHALKMCLNYKVLGAVFAIIVLAYLFVPKIAYFAPYLLILVCPLSMVLMMSGMSHKSRDTSFVCSECGLAYQDKTWAQKCSAWCKEHHSCNLEITKHSTMKT